eukprot:7084520-Heterocapsa_arctica.AAC.1
MVGIQKSLFPRFNHSRMSESSMLSARMFMMSIVLLSSYSCKMRESTRLICGSCMTRSIVADTASIDLRLQGRHGLVANLHAAPVEQRGSMSL